MRRRSLWILLALCLLTAVSISTCSAIVWQNAALLNSGGHPYAKSSRVWAAASGGFHAAYKNADNSALYYRRYQNGVLGGVVDTGARNSYGGHEICEALNGDIWITWENWNESTYPYEQVWAGRSVNGGANWNLYQVTSYQYGEDEGGQAKNPWITPIGTGNSSTVLSLTWRAVEKRMYHNLWNGSSFTGNTQGWWTDNSYAAEGCCRSPQDGSVYRCYGRQSGGIWQIFIRRFDGSTWGPEIQVSQETGDFASRADIAINSSGQILVVWDNVSQCRTRFYDPATGWGPVTIIDDGYTPSVTAIPGRSDFYVVYPTNKGAWDYLAGRRFNSGTWFARDQVSAGIPSSYTPECDISAGPDGTLYAVFEYWGSGQAQQYYTISRDLSGGADNTPPTTPVVTDDGASTDVASYLHASWAQASDPESGIDRYEYSIGTAPGSVNVVAWTNTNLDLEKYVIYRFSPGTYYFNVRVWNKAGLVSSIGSSNGIQITAQANPYSFTAPTTVSSSSYACINPSLARSASGVHLVYQDENNTASKVVYRRKTASAWASPENVTTGSPKGTYPDMVADSNGNLHVFYCNSQGRENMDTFEVIKTGLYWGTPANLSSNNTMDWYPRVALGSNNRIWLAQNGNGNSYTVKSAYKDAAWSGFSDLGTSSRYGNPDIATGSDGVAHMVWIQGSEVKYSRNSGSGWSAPSVIANDGIYSPRIAVDNANNPIVTWRGNPSVGETAVCFSKWTGTSWTPKKILGFGYHNNVAADTGGGIHVVFTTTSGSAVQDVWHLAYNGTTWTIPVNISNNSGTSEWAAVEFSGGAVHVAWQDNTSGLNTILYSSATAPGTISGTVRDASGNPVSGATVTTSTGGYTATSGANGSYTLANVAAGTYTLTASKAFYNSHVKSAIAVTGGQTVTCDFNLTDKPLVTLANAKSMADNTQVDLKEMTVTGVFTDEGFIYVQQSTCGMRVETSVSGLEVGHKVNIVGGKVTTLMKNGIKSERTISGATVTIASSTKVEIKPYSTNTRSIGGGNTSLFRGVMDGYGLNNIGLLVKIVGKVTAKDGEYVFVDDGAGARSALADGTPRIGVKVECGAAGLLVGDIVSITGVITGDVPTGWTGNCPFMRIRSIGDIRKF